MTHMAGFPKKKTSLIPRAGVPLAHERDKIMAGLIKSYGNITRVADTLGVTRFSLKRYIDTDAELVQTLKDVRERKGDLLEDTALNQAVNGNASMTIFLLKSQCQDRGYTFERETDADTIARAAFDYISNQSKSPVTTPTT